MSQSLKIAFRNRRKTVSFKRQHGPFTQASVFQALRLNMRAGWLPGGTRLGHFPKRGSTLGPIRHSQRPSSSNAEAGMAGPNPVRTRCCTAPFLP